MPLEGPLPPSRPWARWGPCSGLALVLGQPHEHRIRSTCVPAPVGLPSFPSVSSSPRPQQPRQGHTVSAHTDPLRRGWPTSLIVTTPSGWLQPLESLSLLGSAPTSILVLEHVAFWSQGRTGLLQRNLPLWTKLVERLLFLAFPKSEMTSLSLRHTPVHSLFFYMKP